MFIFVPYRILCTLTHVFPKKHYYLKLGSYCNSSTITRLRTRTSQCRLFQSKMDGVLNPREAGRFITEHSKDVSIKDEGVNKVADLLFERVKSGGFSVKMWRQHELNPQSMDDDAVNWVFVSAVLNFSFWTKSDSARLTVSYKGKQHTGYWALCAALNRALDEGVKITSPEFYSTISLDQLKQVLRSETNTEMPLMEERVAALNDAGNVLMKKYQGSFANVIRQAGGSAQTLLKLVLQDFASFRDVAEFNGKKVGLYKRAQILVGDIWGSCEGQGLGEFKDIGTITMFADYRVPQALVYFGALSYSDALMEKLYKGELFQSGERQEVEIRGVSLWACELIRDGIVSRLASETESTEEGGDKSTLIGDRVNSVLVDHYLWDTRRAMADEMSSVPFHKCRGIFY